MDQADEMSSCTDTNNNDNSSNTRGEQRRPTRVAEKYGLRPRTIIRRLQLERTRDDTPQRQFKTSKNRPPPLSKYRRKTANARERHRMKEINDAFETLRRVLPDFCSRRAAAAMTKITTLKLADREKCLTLEEEDESYLSCGPSDTVRLLTAMRPQHTLNPALPWWLGQRQFIVE
ncbi:Helix-loop-helix protein delilah [Portunus trituberculatus]|uniref:Helix-loop-helix protein delilah n=1 Tax=Portunus trituberculatus TaxID=210409 RepID=A0A5B7E7S1_PORTR|nr:Helix-loop-helix protein delilah [Portunus trituberculatus]